MVTTDGDSCSEGECGRNGSRYESGSGREIRFWLPLEMYERQTNKPTALMSCSQRHKGSHCPRCHGGSVGWDTGRTEEGRTQSKIVADDWAGAAMQYLLVVQKKL